MDGIRPYGPGKFDTILDSYVYDASLDGGPDEECGEVDTTGWYGLLRAPVLPEVQATDASLLTRDERHLIASSVGAIISEDSQGFVHVEYFDTTKELEAAWRECEGFTHGLSEE